MSLTVSEVALVVASFAPALDGAVLRGVHDDGNETFYLTFRQPGGNWVLVLSTVSAGQRIALVDERPGPAPTTPLPFTSLLRKRAGGRRVSALSLQTVGDRIVVIELTGGLALLVALTGRTAMIALLDDGVVVDAHPRRHGQIGERWAAPPAPVVEARPSRFSSTLPDALGRAIEDHYATALDRRARDARLGSARRLLSRARKRLTRLLTNLEADLARGQDAERERELGDILSANFHRLRRGAASITLPDLYRGGEPVEVVLDPVLDPRTNVDRYYRRHRKYTRARPKLEARISKAEDELLAIEIALDGLPASDAPSEVIEAVERTVRELGLAPRVQPSSKRRDQARLPFRVFRSRAGREIRVGRNASANDALTFRHSRGHDLWLHAAGWSGSHVTVSLNRGEDIDAETLVDAASLAAHYSRGGADSIIEVHYTRRKHVSRAKGGPPGRVYLSTPKTLAIRLDERRLARLLASSNEA